MRKIAAVMLCGIISCSICACGETEEVDSYTVYEDDETLNLWVDPETEIIYIRNKIHAKGGGGIVLTPYYSKNGKLCRWDDHRIVEIE